jgi:hypothetical protein
VARREIGKVSCVVGALGVTETVMIVVVLAACYTPAAITAAKGHVALFFAGLLTIGLVWVIAAVRLAKPNSPWARRYYGPAKLDRSKRRYPGTDVSAPSRAGLAAAIRFGALGAAVLTGVVAALAQGQELP